MTRSGAPRLTLDWVMWNRLMLRVVPKVLLRTKSTPIL